MPWSYRMSYTEDFLLRQSIQVVKTLFVIDRIKHRSYSKNWPPPSFDCNCEDDVWFVWLRVLFPAREELEEHAGDHESNKVQINEAEKAEVGEGEGLGVVVSSIASLRLACCSLWLWKNAWSNASGWPLSSTHAALWLSFTLLRNDSWYLPNVRSNAKISRDRCVGHCVVLIWFLLSKSSIEALSISRRWTSSSYNHQWEQWALL